MLGGDVAGSSARVWIAEDGKQRPAGPPIALSSEATTVIAPPHTHTPTAIQTSAPNIDAIS